MIQNFPCSSETRLALRHHFIHAGDFRTNLSKHRLSRRSMRPGAFRRFASSRHITDADHNPSLCSILPRWLSGKGLASREYATESLHRSRVREVEMLEDFRGAPLPFRTNLHLLSRQNRDRRRDFAMKFLQMRVHEGYSPSSCFRLECCRNDKPMPVISGRMP